MDETYTKRLEIEIWNMAKELDENEDFSKVIEFLNSKEGFQPFGKRLAVFIAKKLDLDSTDRKTLVQALNEACGKTGVDLSEIASDGTLRNWFDKDMRPKKGDDSRLSMFALAFELQLSVDETKELFHKIYIDRAFNYRSEKEVIYYFCLKNNKTWADAKRMIAEVENMAIETSDHTQLTNVIAINVDTMSDEKVLLEYIRENGHNFEKNSVMAQRTLNKYLSEAKQFAKEEKEEAYDPKLYQGKWKNLSTNALYEIIIGASITGSKGTKTVFNNSILPKEIKNRFPEAATFGKKNLTAEEYRKAIIMLFSYCFWYQAQSSDKNFEFDDYFDALNGILNDCNFSQIYYGNPYDWMFSFCALSERSLDTFRGLLAEVLD